MHLHTVRHTQTHPSQINESQWSILTLIMSNIVMRCLNAFGGFLHLGILLTLKHNKARIASRFSYSISAKSQIH